MLTVFSTLHNLWGPPRIISNSLVNINRRWSIPGVLAPVRGHGGESTGEYGRAGMPAVVDFSDPGIILVL